MDTGEEEEEKQGEGDRKKEWGSRKMVKERCLKGLNGEEREKRKIEGTLYKSYTKKSFEKQNKYSKEKKERVRGGKGSKEGNTLFSVLVSLHCFTSTDPTNTQLPSVEKKRLTIPPSRPIGAAEHCRSG